MKSLGQQFADIIIPRSDLSDVAERGAELVAEQMKKNTDAGTGFGSDTYVNDYSTSYAKSKKGGRTSPVTLRGEQRRIEDTQVNKQASGGVRIKFSDEEGGRIFRFHHEGNARGGKTRSIFPKAVQSVPVDIREEIQISVREALSK